MERLTDARAGSSERSPGRLRGPGGDGAAGSSAAPDPPAGERGAGASVARVRSDLLVDRTALDPARAVAAGPAAAGVLHGPLGAAVGGAIELQHPVSVVPRPVDRGTGLGRDGVHQEPRPA